MSMSNQKQMRKISSNNKNIRGAKIVNKNSPKQCKKCMMFFYNNLIA